MAMEQKEQREIRKSTPRALFVGGSVLMLVAGIYMASTSANADPVEMSADKIDICHSTSAEVNPYVQLSVAKDELNGHDKDPMDIIPPFDGKEGKNGYPAFPGLNWTNENQIIWQNGCKIVDPTESPSPTQSPTPPPVAEVTPPEPSLSPEAVTIPVVPVDEIPVPAGDPDLGVTPDAIQEPEAISDPELGVAPPTSIPAVRAGLSN